MALRSAASWNSGMRQEPFLQRTAAGVADIVQPGAIGF
jgi:hypothetical protein